MEIITSLSPARIKNLNTVNIKKGHIVYWMSSQQRVNDNWALIYAFDIAKSTESKLSVVFNLIPTFLDATLRQYDFMIKGLQQVEQNLCNLGINFELLIGDPVENISKYTNTNKVTALVKDFSALKVSKGWEKALNKKLDCAFFVVDAQNIVPIWEASDKQEYGAYTIRSKINKQLNHYLTNFPKLKNLNDKIKPTINWAKTIEKIKVDTTVKPIKWLKPGEKEALKVLNLFLDEKLDKYDTNRNDPNKKVLSNLSPYLHFGHISAQTIALKGPKSESFLEELIVRRELASNYCFYNENYDNFRGFLKWAQETLNQHIKDEREYLYKLEDFEYAKTHDEAWNAAQIEMVKLGKMHGYMRMYWAKKILEWTKSPQEAQKIAIYLNDKYELDGRDPNGYTGIAWAIGGVHDRPWFERPIFGKIRYMNYNGLKRKFDIQSYIKYTHEEI